MGPDLRGAIRRNDSRLFSLPPTIVILFIAYIIEAVQRMPFPLLLFSSSFCNISYIYIYTQLFDLQKPWLIPYSIHHSNPFQRFVCVHTNVAFHSDLPIRLSQFYFYINSFNITLTVARRSRLTVIFPHCDRAVSTSV